MLLRASALVLRAADRRLCSRMSGFVQRSVSKHLPNRMPWHSLAYCSAEPVGYIHDPGGDEARPAGHCYKRSRFKRARREDATSREGVRSRAVLPAGRVQPQAGGAVLPFTMPAAALFLTGEHSAFGLWQWASWPAASHHPPASFPEASFDTSMISSRCSTN